MKRKFRCDLIRPQKKLNTAIGIMETSKSIHHFETDSKHVATVETLINFAGHFKLRKGDRFVVTEFTKKKSKTILDVKF